MGKIIAWQCVHCRTLFEDKKSMENHRRKCAKETKERQRKENERQKAIEEANSFRLEAEDINDLRKMIEEMAKNLGRKLKFTSWDLKFKHDLQATHNNPIGKAREWDVFRTERTNYLGWEGKVRGTTDLYKNPIKHNKATFGKIDGLHGLTEAYFCGVHVSGGGGGGDFYSTIRLYLDDFPKLKEKYDLWKTEADKKNIYDKKSSELRIKAMGDLVDNDKRIIALEDVNKILRARIKQIHEQRKDVKENIMSSVEWQEAVIVPDELKYDFGLYKKYYNMFNREY